ncbi:hypothetical protein DFQ30_007895, partial [Apophysomyces sp. BC1015]
MPRLTKRQKIARNKPRSEGTFVQSAVVHNSQQHNENDFEILATFDESEDTPTEPDTQLSLGLKWDCKVLGRG